MKRLTGWERRLEDYLAARWAVPFQWGAQDCCRFACGGVTAQTGVDPMQDVARYRSANGARLAMHRLGGTLDAAATVLGEKAGLREIPPAFAGRGCVVLADVDTGTGTVETALGLVGMAGTQAHFAGPDGLVWRPLRDCRRAWGYD